MKYKTTVYPYIYPTPSVDVEVDAASVEEALTMVQEKLRISPPFYELTFDSVDKVWFVCSSCEEEYEPDSAVTCPGCKESFCTDCYESHLRDNPKCHAHHMV